MKKNIVLTGIMGCGKTSIGIAISYKLKMPVVDMDKIIERTSKMTINEIFEKHGEEYFRNLETETAKRLSNLNGYIISTGGGVVLRKENMDYLSKTGYVIYINRTPDDIVKSVKTENRPLLASGADKLCQIYEERHSLYTKYSDITVNNNADFNRGVENVLYAIDLLKEEQNDA